MRRAFSSLGIFVSGLLQRSMVLAIDYRHEGTGAGPVMEEGLLRVLKDDGGLLVFRIAGVCQCKCKCKSGGGGQMRHYEVWPSIGRIQKAGATPFVARPLSASTIGWHLRGVKVRICPLCGHARGQMQMQMQIRTQKQMQIQNI